MQSQAAGKVITQNTRFFYEYYIGREESRAMLPEGHLKTFFFSSKPLPFQTAFRNFNPDLKFFTALQILIHFSSLTAKHVSCKRNMLKGKEKISFQFNAVITPQLSLCCAVKTKSIKISANEYEFDFCMQVMLFFMVFLQPVLKILFQK